MACARFTPPVPNALFKSDSPVETDPLDAVKTPTREYVLSAGSTPLMPNTKLPFSVAAANAVVSCRSKEPEPVAALSNHMNCP